MNTRPTNRHLILATMCLSFVAFIFALPARAQIVTNTNANIAFGRIDFADSHNGTVRLGTDGSVDTTGSGMSARDNGNAGRVQITQPDTGIVDIKCSTTAQLVDPDAPSLTISNIEIAVNTGVGFGSGTACQGVLPADPVTTTVDLDALIDPNILIGGEVTISNLSSFPDDREYSTSGGGSAIQLSITVQ